MWRKMGLVLVCSLLLSVLFYLASSGMAEGSMVSAPKGGSAMESAVEVNIGTNYHFSKAKGWVEGWYKIKAPEKGKYYLHSNTIGANASVNLDIYDMYGKRIVEKKYGGYYGESTISFVLSQSQWVYFYLRYYDETIISICSPSQHAMLSGIETRKHPTCTTSGYSARVCEICGAETDKETIPATGHTPGSAQVERESTCLVKGLKTVKCTVCGEILERENLPLLSHTPGKEQVVQESTCLVKGLKTVTCTVCGEILERESLPLLDHTPGRMEVIKAPTCTKAGLNEQRCTVCNTLLNSETLAALGHDPGDWETVVEPTRSAQGKRVQKCTRCQEIVNQETIEALGISEDEQKSIRNATVLATMKHSGNQSLNLSWMKVNDAEGYEISFSKKDETSKTIDVGKVLEYTVSDLEEGAEYTATVRAYGKASGSRIYSKGMQINAFAGGSSAKKTNPKSIKLEKTKIKLKKGKSAKIKATVKGVKSNLKLLTTPKKLRYISNNTSIATVSAKGKVKAVGKGTTTIYVIAANGVRKGVKVTVK